MTIDIKKYISRIYNSNLVLLFRYGIIYQNYNINEKFDANFSNLCNSIFTLNLLAKLTLSILIIFLIPKGLNNDFSGYIISALSLFIGLFFTFIFTLFDKYKNKNFKKLIQESTIENSGALNKDSNFYKKVTFLTLYSILIAIISIFLNSINLVLNIENTSINCKNYLLNNHYTELYIPNWRKIVILIYRFLNYYFIISFFSLTIKLLSSIFEYLNIEYKK